jgi:hypothetical protein
MAARHEALPGASLAGRTSDGDVPQGWQLGGGDPRNGKRSYAQPSTKSLTSCCGEPSERGFIPACVRRQKRGCSLNAGTTTARWPYSGHAQRRLQEKSL